MEAVQKANSGHPGMPMGMADVVTILFKYFLELTKGFTLLKVLALSVLTETTLKPYFSYLILFIYLFIQ